MNIHENRSALLWCLWGAVMASVPFALILSALILFEVSALVAPVQFNVESVSLALLVLTLVRSVLLRGNRREVVQPIIRLCPIVGLMSLLCVLFCESSLVMMRVGYQLPLLTQQIVSILAVVSQTSMLLSWALYGILCLPSHDQYQNAGQGMATGVTAFLFGSCWPVLSLFLSCLFPGLMSAVLCPVSSLIAFILLTKLLFSGVTNYTLWSNIAMLFAGLAVSTIFRNALSDVLLTMPSNLLQLNAVSSLHAVLFFCLLLIIVVSGVTGCAYLSCDGENSTDGSSDVASVLQSFQRGASLSDRQREVLILRLEGQKIADVSKKLGIHRGTVSTFQSRALSALGVSSLDELSEQVENALERLTNERKNACLAKDRANKYVGITFLLAVTAVPILVTVIKSSLEIVVLISGMLYIAVACGIWMRNSRVPHSELSDETKEPSYSLLLVSTAVLGFYLCNPPGLTVGGMVLALTTVILHVLRLGAGGLRSENASHVQDLIHLFSMSSWKMLSSNNFSYLMVFGCALTLGGLYHIDVEVCSWLSIAALYVCDALTVASLVAYIKRARQSCIYKNRNGETAIISKLLDLGLNETEAKVAWLISQGYSQLEIARRLRFAHGTILGCRAAAYRKLEIHTANELRELLKTFAAQECQK